MSKLFGQAQQGGNVYEQKYNSARMNLLIVVAFTVINLILLVTNSDTYFLFSAFVPYFITVIGMVLCGRFPMEDYSDASGLQFVFLDDSVFVVLLVISIIITLFYFLAWLMSSKNRGGWLIFALVFFSIAEESRTHIGFKRYFCPYLRCASSEDYSTPSLDAP